jgi:hypothetical protein
VVNIGKVSQREIDEAPIVEVVPTCGCKAGLDANRADNVLRCPKCGRPGMEQEDGDGAA